MGNEYEWLIVGVSKDDEPIFDEAQNEMKALEKAFKLQLDGLDVQLYKHHVFEITENLKETFKKAMWVEAVNSIPTIIENLKKHLIKTEEMIEQCMDKDFITEHGKGLTEPEKVAARYRETLIEDRKQTKKQLAIAECALSVEDPLEWDGTAYVFKAELGAPLKWNGSEWHKIEEIILKGEKNDN